MTWVCKMKKRTQQEFIDLANKKHENKYTYENVRYTNAHGHLYVTCKDHGDFRITANQHLKGAGCPKCVGRNRTTEEFIAVSRSLHGDKYSYTKTKYIGSDKKVVITCPTHGDFQQTAKAHMKGHGCSKCGGTDSYENSEFIDRAKSIHGDTYDYSKVEYSSNKRKVIITCKIHGDFLQKPNSHLQGKGCPSCGGTKKLSTEDFINRARVVHGDRYSYSKSEYTNNQTKIIITCKNHGDFEQLPANHLHGWGCIGCSPVKPHTDESIRVLFNLTHGGRYDYRKVKYAGINKKVTIVCKDHGDFQQTPKMHIYGSGCPECAVTGYNPNASKGWLYIVAFGDFIGFGISNFIDKRLSRHKSNIERLGMQMEILKIYELSSRQALDIETEIKRNFKNFIVDSGVAGFKSEALPSSFRQDLINSCDSCAALTFCKPCDTH